jgi:phenylalanyl-tRNA synthetase beta chain
MKISYNWLQSYIDEKLPTPEVLADKIVFGSFEVEGIDAVGDDTVLDINVLPNRAHDCLSHYGMAREVCGLLGLTLKPIESRHHESVESDVRVSVEMNLCRRYIARKIFNVKVGPSPEWLSSRLEAIGQRSINNVVDATNFVMFAFGQPMHAFDYDKMANGHIIVRPAKEGESITTLDGKIIALEQNIMVVADERHPLAIAGVKGGSIAEVDESTKTIIVEVANFDPVAVRKTARRLGILTDSAKRFENELTPHLAGQMIHVITDLIVDLAGGQPEDPVDAYQNAVTQNTVTFSTDLISRMLGVEITPVEIREILNRYGHVFQEESEVFKLTVPFERLDITGPHDMVEEIGRAYGYDKITPKLPTIDFKPAINEAFAKICAVKNDLVEKGYSEVQTYTFVKKGDFEVAYGAVGKSALRTNLSDGLKKSYELNKQNADLLGNSETKVFEVGTVFPKSGEEVHVAFADKSGVQEVNLDEYVSRNNILYSGYVFPEQKKGTRTFKMWSEYPFITRDISFWIPKDSLIEEIIPFLRNALAEASSDVSLSVESVRMVDDFSKGEKRSLAFRFVFQSFERTLTNEEIDKVMEVIYEKVRGRGWEVR